MKVFHHACRLSTVEGDCEIQTNIMSGFDGRGLGGCREGMTDGAGSNEPRKGSPWPGARQALIPPLSPSSVTSPV